MEMDSLLPFNLLFPLFISSLLISSSAFTPNISYYLDCGSSTTTRLQADNPQRDFVADSSYLTSASNSVSISNSSSTSSPLYTTARVFTSATSYEFHIPSQGTHVIRLHFFPFSTQSYALTTARFTVSALNSFLLLPDSSAAVNATPTIKEYLLWVDSDQLLLTFTPNSSSFAFINAIEVFTAPSNFIDVSSGPVETLHRINVGGLLITPANDTLWRTWLPDDNYIYRIDFSAEKNTSAQSIKYYISDPRRTPEIAPATVYSTARTMNMNQTLVLSNSNFFNVTWSFPVPAGQTYFVRLHFCDFLSQTNQLSFNVYLGDLLEYGPLTPSSLTADTPAAAFFLDFSPISAISGLLNVSIGSNSSNRQTANAILNGVEIMKIGLPSITEHNNKKNILKFLIPSILGGVLLIAAVITLLIVWVRRRRRRPMATPEPKETQSTWSTHPGDGRTSAISLSSKSSDRTTNTASPRVNLALHISYLEIESATNNFDEKLVIGTGGFGQVYKGVLTDGTRVAVKRGMRGSRQGFPEFQTEIVVLSRIRHRHLVSLIGYCDDRSEMILVYEYMEKGTLRNYLYGSELPCLTWKQRLEICISAARGLHYLHTGYSDNIIHRDVKSTNILLGEDYSAKVSDFGLSRLGPSFTETHVSTGVKGTFGYLDPEYFKTQKLTDKSDVYSFGVMMFEVLCARPVIDQSVPRQEVNLAEWALLSLRRGQLEKIIDPRLVGKINANSLRKFGETAEKCLADYGVDRPAMGDVLWNLEYSLQLQETEVRREPFEDSGNLESDMPVMSRAPPTGMRMDEGEKAREEGMARMNEKMSEVTTSSVFSQLVTDEGR